MIGQLRPWHVNFYTAVAAPIVKAATGASLGAVAAPLTLGLSLAPLAIKALQQIHAGSKAANKFTDANGPQGKMNAALAKAAQIGGTEGKAYAQQAWQVFQQEAKAYAALGSSQKKVVEQAMNPNEPFMKTVNSIVGQATAAIAQPQQQIPGVQPQAPQNYTASDLLNSFTGEGRTVNNSGSASSTGGSLLSLGGGILDAILNRGKSKPTGTTPTGTTPTGTTPGTPVTTNNRLLPSLAGSGVNILGAILASRAANRAGEQLGAASDQTAQSFQEWLNAARDQRTRDTGLLGPYADVGTDASKRILDSEDELTKGYDVKFDPTKIKLEDDPGFKSRMKNAIDALESSASAKGVINSGGTRQLVLEKGADIGSQEYQAAYNRNLGEWKDNRDTFYANQANKSNQLFRAADLGRGAAVSQAGIESGDINGLGEALTTLGNTNEAGATARATGNVGAANAWQQALQSIGDEIFSTWGASQAAQAPGRA